jgi:hypothetical protein
VSLCGDCFAAASHGCLAFDQAGKRVSNKLSTELPDPERSRIPKLITDAALPVQDALHDALKEPVSIIHDLGGSVAADGQVGLIVS